MGGHLGCRQTNPRPVTPCRLFVFYTPRLRSPPRGSFPSSKCSGACRYSSTTRPSPDIGRGGSFLARQGLPQARHQTGGPTHR